MNMTKDGSDAEEDDESDMAMRTMQRRVGVSGLVPARGSRELMNSALHVGPHSASTMAQRMRSWLQRKSEK